MPFYVGRFALDSALIAGHWVRLAMYPAGVLAPARRDRTIGWLDKILPAHASVFGEIPFRNYTVFVRTDTLVDGGGLEHQSSQVDEILSPRADRHPQPTRLTQVANWIASVNGSPPTALSDASLSAWIPLSDRSAGLYYPKGALTGLLLDIFIRNGSGNRHSLDDVMRQLYESTYKRGHGFTGTEWWAAVASNAAPTACKNDVVHYVANNPLGDACAQANS